MIVRANKSATGGESRFHDACYSNCGDISLEYAISATKQGTYEYEGPASAQIVELNPRSEDIRVRMVSDEGRRGETESG